MTFNVQSPLPRGSLSEWITHVFDHPVADPRWYWADDAPVWEGTPDQIANFIADAFERSGDLLARFSDAQLDQGFWYLVSNSCSEFMYCLVDPLIPQSSRFRALRSFVPLFEQVMACRCSPHLSHLDEKGANPLNSACYMWWDLLPIHGAPKDPTRAEFDAEVIAVLESLLRIPQDACRESALHGIGHWVIYYPRAAEVVDDFLARSPELRPELVRYARAAKSGSVQ